MPQFVLIRFQLLLIYFVTDRHISTSFSSNLALCTYAQPNWAIANPENIYLLLHTRNTIQAGSLKAKRNEKFSSLDPINVKTSNKYQIDRNLFKSFLSAIVVCVAIKSLEINKHFLIINFFSSIHVIDRKLRSETVYFHLKFPPITHVSFNKTAFASNEIQKIQEK